MPRALIALGIILVASTVQAEDCSTPESVAPGDQKAVSLRDRIESEYLKQSALLLAQVSIAKMVLTTRNAQPGLGAQAGLSINQQTALVLTQTLPL